MAKKEIQETRTINECDNCKKETHGINRVDKIENDKGKLDKELCDECFKEYKQKVTEKCNHDNFKISFRDYYTSKLVCMCNTAYCEFLIQLTENDLNKNKIIVAEFKKYGDKKQNKKESVGK